MYFNVLNRDAIRIAVEQCCAATTEGNMARLRKGVSYIFALNHRCSIFSSNAALADWPAPSSQY